MFDYAKKEKVILIFTIVVLLSCVGCFYFFEYYIKFKVQYTASQIREDVDINKIRYNQNCLLPTVVSEQKLHRQCEEWQRGFEGMDEEKIAQMAKNKMIESYRFTFFHSFKELSKFAFPFLVVVVFIML